MRDIFTEPSFIASLQARRVNPLSVLRDLPGQRSQENGFATRSRFPQSDLVRRAHEMMKLMNTGFGAITRWSLVLAILVLAASPSAEAAYRYTNLPPTISGTPPLEVVVGQMYDFTPKASDPEGRTLVFSIYGLPQWAKFDRYTGRLSGVPGAANAGTTGKIVIAVSDKKTMAYLPEFRITVRSATTTTTPTSATTNTAPQISGTPSGTGTVGVAYSFQPSASDGNGDVLTFRIGNQPAWATFNTATGLLSGTPTVAGSYSAISISVSDGTTSTALPAFSIVVADPVKQNTAPTITGTLSNAFKVPNPFTNDD